MILLSHPTGNANSRQNAQALHEAGRLAEFWTCIAWKKNGRLSRYLPGAVRSQLERRAFEFLPSDLVHTHPIREWGRLLAQKTGPKALLRHETGLFCIDAVYRDFDARVAAALPGKSSLTAVMASEDGAASTFRMAQRLGLQRIYELPIGYWRAAREILQEEAELEPEWACTLTGMRDSERKLTRKDEELSLANTLIVASTFTRETLKKAPFSLPAVQVVPYGCPPVTAAESVRASSSRLRVLFVGSLGQRKGVSYLLKAVEALGTQVELTLIGHKTSDDCRPLNSATIQHRWISTLPHPEILREMSAHDVLVFPSLFEGFGLVITEALSQGLPVIATPHTAGPDVLMEGENGFIVPIRNWEAIAERLEQLHRDRDLLAKMKLSARESASINGWQKYRSRLVAAMPQNTPSLTSGISS